MRQGLDRTHQRPLKVSLRRLWWRSSQRAALFLLRLILSRWGFRRFVFNLDDFLQDVQKVLFSEQSLQSYDEKLT